MEAGIACFDLADCEPVLIQSLLRSKPCGVAPVA